MTQPNPPAPLKIDVDAHLREKIAGASLDTPVTGEDAATHATVVARAPVYATFAILSHNAYKRNPPLALPPGWSEVTERRFDTGEGLAYAVFERSEGRRVAEVVVAFRGTDDVHDWVHNLDPFYRKQGKPAADAFKRVAEHYGPQRAKLSATGHSLGGGLALEMALKFPGVEAIAFNSSPILKAGDHRIMDNKRTSVWEAGEILAPLRDAKSEWLDEWEGTELVKVNFEHGSAFTQHAIAPMARNLVKLAALYSAPFRDLRI